MTHGHFIDALNYHALAPVVLLYLAFLWAYKMAEVFLGRAPRVPSYTISGYALTTISIFWIVRLTAFFGMDNGLAVALHDNVIARLLRVMS